MLKAIWLSTLLFHMQYFALQLRSVASPHNEAKLTFCELVKHPSEYDGKVVVVTAWIGFGPEGSIYFDDSCKSQTEDTIAQATYVGDDLKPGTPLYKKLRKILKNKNKAEETVVARFVDGKARVFGHQNCCRYKLEVQKILTVDGVDVSGLGSSAH
jgi:hypothetical protein